MLANLGTEPVALPEGATVAAGDALTIDGREVGVVTSAAGERALAYVRREVEPPADAMVGDTVVRIEAIPTG